ncbi:MAG: hypothetical protein J7498_14910 [Sphingobium sp.]|nr:hypothetical protein [Sphingobium sp.]
MTPLAKAMEIVFICAWGTAVAGHLYGTRYFLPRWAAGFRRRPEHEGYGRKILIGYGIFLASVTIGFAAGGIAEFWGGGWG